MFLFLFFYVTLEERTIMEIEKKTKREASKIKKKKTETTVNEPPLSSSLNLFYIV